MSYLGAAPEAFEITVLDSHSIGAELHTQAIVSELSHPTLAVFAWSVVCAN